MAPSCCCHANFVKVRGLPPSFWVDDPTGIENDLNPHEVMGFIVVLVLAGKEVFFTHACLHYTKRQKNLDKYGKTCPLVSKALSLLLGRSMHLHSIYAREFRAQSGSSMEKRGRVKCNFLSFLPKAVSPFTFLSPPTSPVVVAGTGKGISGPVIPLIPKEARRRARNGSFDAREPTSPKVSCMGQIQNNRNKKKTRSKQEIKLTSRPRVTVKAFNGKTKGPKSDPFEGRPSVARGVLCLGHVKQFAREPTAPKISCLGQLQNKKSIKKIKPQEETQGTKLDSRPKETLTGFSGKKQGPTSDTFEGRSPLAQKVPSLGRMKRFTSGRGELKSFNWRDYDVSGIQDKQNCFSDKDRDEDEAEMDIVTHSEPREMDDEIPIVPKKEVNLWKRRSMPPPRPLELEK